MRLVFADTLAPWVNARDTADWETPAKRATSVDDGYLVRRTSGDVPRFNMVLPNGCEDGEANCKPVNNRYTQFDDFLAREVPKIEASPAFGRDGVIIVVYDEDERAGGPEFTGTVARSN